MWSSLSVLWSHLISRTVVVLCLQHPEVNGRRPGRSELPPKAKPREHLNLSFIKSNKSSVEVCKVRLSRSFHLHDRVALSGTFAWCVEATLAVLEWAKSSNKRRNQKQTHVVTMLHLHAPAESRHDIHVICPLERCACFICVISSHRMIVVGSLCFFLLSLSVFSPPAGLFKPADLSKQSFAHLTQIMRCFTRRSFPLKSRALFFWLHFWDLQNMAPCPYKNKTGCHFCFPFVWNVIKVSENVGEADAGDPGSLRYLWLGLIGRLIKCDVL